MVLNIKSKIGNPNSCNVVTCRRNRIARKDYFRTPFKNLKRPSIIWENVSGNSNSVSIKTQTIYEGI